MQYTGTRAKGQVEAASRSPTADRLGGTTRVSTTISPRDENAEIPPVVEGGSSSSAPGSVPQKGHLQIQTPPTSLLVSVV